MRIARVTRTFDCTIIGNEVSQVKREGDRWTLEQHESFRFVGAVLTMMLGPDQSD